MSNTPKQITAYFNTHGGNSLFIPEIVTLTTVELVRLVSFCLYQIEHKEQMQNNPEYRAMFEQDNKSKK